MTLDESASDRRSACVLATLDVSGSDPRSAAGPTVHVFRAARELGLRWRLISGNGREVGRSRTAFGDRETAVADVRRITDAISAASVRIVGDGVRAWRWQIEVDGEVEVEASHAFDRRLRCEQAASLFFSLLPEAEIRDGVLEPGVRRTRGMRVSATHATDAFALVASGVVVDEETA